MVELDNKMYYNITQAANFIGIKYPILYMYLHKFNVLDFGGKKFIPVEEAILFKELREAKAKVKNMKL